MTLQRWRAQYVAVKRLFALEDQVKSSGGMQAKSGVVTTNLGICSCLFFGSIFCFYHHSHHLLLLFSFFFLFFCFKVLVKTSIFIPQILNEIYKKKLKKGDEDK